jgi:hypothetical protein
MPRRSKLQFPIPRPEGVDIDQRLTSADLAALLGHRSKGRYTQGSTVRVWISRGIGGVRMRAEWDGCRYITTWRWYEEWIQERIRVREEVIKRRLAAVRVVLEKIPGTRDYKQLQKRKERARKRLEELESQHKTLSPEILQKRREAREAKRAATDT